MDTDDRLDIVWPMGWPFKPILVAVIMHKGRCFCFPLPLREQLNPQGKVDRKSSWMQRLLDAPKGIADFSEDDVRTMERKK